MYIVIEQEKHPETPEWLIGKIYGPFETQEMADTAAEILNSQHAWSEFTTLPLTSFSNRVN